MSAKSKSFRYSLGICRPCAVIIMIIISFQMPGRVKVRLLAARDLPVMDRASDLTDAFVEVMTSATILYGSLLHYSVS